MLKVNPEVNYGLRMMMMCQCRFIACYKHTTLTGDENRGGRECVGVENGYLANFFLQFFCETKTALKKWSLKKQHKQLEHRKQNNRLMLRPSYLGPGFPQIWLHTWLLSCMKTLHAVMLNSLILQPF